ncbi:MAG: hypothetical protein U1F57_03395 [bacterium]
MNNPLHDILNRALQKQETHSSLRSFYAQHSFSFSYEYLRKTFSGERVPNAKKIEEIANALNLDPAFLHRAAKNTRLERKIRDHYRLPPTATLGRFSEKIKTYRREGKTESKILDLLEKVGEKEKDQVLQYLKFLKKQCRPRKRKTRK